MRETLDCFFLFHDIMANPILKHPPEFFFLSDTLLAQSEFVTIQSWWWYSESVTENEPSLFTCSWQSMLAGYKNRYAIRYDLNRDQIRICMVTNSDWARSVSDRKKNSGGCFSMGLAMISWKRKKQSSVSLICAEENILQLVFPVVKSYGFIRFYHIYSF